MAEERSLGDLAEDEVRLVDTSVTPTPEGFDLDEWVAGIRPTRRSVRLYPQAHLIARMEELAGRIDRLPDGPEVNRLVDEFEATKVQFKDGVWFTVEKRSSEWVNDFREKKVAELSFPEELDSTQVLTLALHQVAAQTIAPPGVTYRHMRAIWEANEGEVNKLIVALTAANTVLAEKAGVFDLDFSQRRSGKTRT